MTQTPPPQRPYQQPYQQPPQQPYPQPYPQPYYGPPPNLPAAPGAQTALVCGIIGCTGLVLGPIALSNSKKAKAVIAAQPMSYGGAGLATAGYVLGIIATIWGAIAVVYIVVWVIIFGAIMSSGGMGM